MKVEVIDKASAIVALKQFVKSNGCIINNLDDIIIGIDGACSNGDVCAMVYIANDVNDNPAMISDYIHGDELDFNFDREVKDDPLMNVFPNLVFESYMIVEASIAKIVDRFDIVMAKPDVYYLFSKGVK